MITQKCTKCKRTQDEEEFYWRGAGYIGRRRDCRTCINGKKIKRRIRRRRITSIETDGVWGVHSQDLTMDVVEQRKVLVRELHRAKFKRNWGQVTA